MEEKRYPKGHFIGLGVAIGIPLGMPIGFALGNIALGPAIGAALGVPIGIVLEKKKNPNPRPLTPEEEIIKKRNITILLGLGLILFIAGVIIFLLFKQASQSGLL